jgi:PEP-utilising enzyme, mobile domain/Pyruvate phosphate dikinase, AMP/ATP-binding domain
MSTCSHRLLSLSELTAPAGPFISNASWVQSATAGGAGPPVAVADAVPAQAAAVSMPGAKAAGLAAARAAGFPVLPGWVLPAAESRPAIRAGAAAVRGGRPAAARRAALGCPPDAALAGELRAAVHSLGGRVIVRSSSPLESDPRWAGAFSSVAEVGPDDVVTAVRSCWAAAFAVDPLARLDACGLSLDALELALLIQPELRPDAGGTARVIPVTGPDWPGGPAKNASPGGPVGTDYDPARLPGDGTAAQPSALDGPGNGSAAHPAAGHPAPPGVIMDGVGGRPGPIDVIVDGVAGHPGALLAGWAEGASARVRLADPAAPGWPEPSADGPLTGLLGAGLVAAVARLAAGVCWALGDTSIEWAADHGTVWLLQTTQAGPVPVLPPEPAGAPAGHGAAPDGRAAAQAGPPGRVYAAREMMPLLAAAVQAVGRRLAARPAVAGQAAGRLVPCRPHQRPAAGCRDAILLIDQPVPALAPLLFAARGVIARGGAAGAHLAEVARSLAVPMVTGCRPELVTGPAPATGGWLAAIDGGTGEVALLPA